MGGVRLLQFFRNYFKFWLVPTVTVWIFSQMKQRRDFQEDIQELNTAFLMLAQQMLREDRESAMFRLGIDGEIADLIVGLSGPKLVRMANCQMVLPAFRFDNAALMKMLAGEGRDLTSTSLHAAIVAAAQAPEKLPRGEDGDEK